MASMASPRRIGSTCFPMRPPLWEKHHNGDVVGVSDDPPGETYWKVANGIRLTGMPAFKNVLTDTQMWQVSLLLANADKPLPPAALQTLRSEVVPPSLLLLRPVIEVAHSSLTTRARRNKPAYQGIPAHQGRIGENEQS